MPSIFPVLRLRLWHRLLIAFVALSGGVLLGFVAWQLQAFRGRFVDYLDAVALQRLEPAAERLATAYVQHRDWNFLGESPRRLGEYVEPGRRPHGPPPDEFRGEPPDRGFDRPPPPPPGPPDLMPRLLLVDASGRRVAGNEHVPEDAPSLAVTVDGAIVGRLRLARQPELSAAVDRAFARTQAHDALVAGLVILALAWLLAYVLSRRLLAPVHVLARGTRALADGDYSRRVDASRSDELGDLGGDFNHLAATLERNRDARRQWGADIAHELRTPLSVLRGEVQALQDGVRQPVPAAFDSLQAECERLGHLIEDLYQLSLADVGALEYRFETLDLAELVQQGAAMQVAACADERLVLELPASPALPVRGDARRLAQLLENLLANSRRYTDTPGRIRLELQRTATHARLFIDDTPPAVPAAALSRLFDRLYRVESSRTRARGGAGLGLAICRAIVDAHGGRIEARESPLGGLRIVLELPLAERVA